MRSHVIFGTGPVAMAVATELFKQGASIRFVSKSGNLSVHSRTACPELEQSDWEIIGADATNRQEVLDASRGFKYMYHCANPLYHQWQDILPPIQANLIEAALENDAVLASSENLYMYKRGIEVIRDGAEIAPPTRKGALRQRLHEELIAAGKERGLKWVSIRASDFFGPGASGQSMFGTTYFLDPLFNGRKRTILGNPDVLHSYTYVGDFGRAIAVASTKPEAYERAWIVPQDGTESSADLAQEFMDAAGKTSGSMRLTKPLLFLIGLFDPVVRELPEMLYQKTETYVVDGSEFAERFDFQPTDRKTAIAETLSWYERLSQQK